MKFGLKCSLLVLLSSKCISEAVVSSLLLDKTTVTMPGMQGTAGASAET